MNKTLTMCAASAFVIVAASAQAAQHDQTEPGTMQGDARMQGMMDQGGMSHGDMSQGGGMMGQAGMGGGMMLTMMMAMMDTNGDGALSLEEVQAVHERMFGMADGDGDGQLSADEIQGLMMGGGMMGERSQ